MTRREEAEETRRGCRGRRKTKREYDEETGERLKRQDNPVRMKVKSLVNSAADY